MTPEPLSDTATPIDSDLLCGGCGQNLRGVPIDRCPECGRRFDRGRHLSINIPWERRAGLGRLRAFGRTVSAVTFRPSLLIDPTDNPLTLRAAKGFRLRAVLGLFVPMLLAALAWHLGPARGMATPRIGRWILPGRLPPLAVLLSTPWFFYTTAVGVLLSLLSVTGMASLFFAPRHLSPVEQQRGVAASYYANALLVWLVPMLGFASFGGWLENSIDPLLSPNLKVAAQCFKFAMYAAAGVALIAWWLIPCRLLYAITRSVPRVLIFAIAWPLLCIAASLCLLIGLHLLVNFVTLVLATW